MRAYFSVKPEGIQGLFQPFHFFYAIGDGISEREAQAYIRNLADSGAITNREARMIKSSCSDAALERVRSADGRNALRADIMRHVLIALMG